MPTQINGPDAGVYRLTDTTDGPQRHRENTEKTLWRPKAS
jgi:hypothetical protein